MYTSFPASIPAFFSLPVKERGTIWPLEAMYPCGEETDSSVSIRTKKVTVDEGVDVLGQTMMEKSDRAPGSL